MFQVNVGTRKHDLNSYTCICLSWKYFRCVFISDFRVFSDRLVDHKDMEEFVALLEKTLTSHFDLQFDSVCPEKQTPIFG